MQGPIDRRSISNRNLHFVEDIRKTRSTKKYTEWQATAIFYSALHLVNLFALKHDKLELRKHDRRSEYMKRPNGPLAPVKWEYLDLSKAAYEARYKGRRPSDGDINVYLNHCRVIESRIDGLLCGTITP